MEPYVFYDFRGGTIVQVGRVMELNVFYDFQGWNHCPGGRCDGTPLSKPDGILQVGISCYQSTLAKKREILKSYLRKTSS